MRARVGSVVMGITAGMALLAVAGCTSASTTPAGPPTLAPPSIGPVTNPTSWIAANSTMPLIAAYDPSDHDEETLRQARIILTVDCMHKGGFADFVASDIGNTKRTAASTATYRAAGAYGYVDDANNSSARAHGFHEVGGSIVAGRKLPATEQNAFDACVKSAQDTIDKGTDSVTTGNSLLNDLLNQSQVAATADGRVRAATKVWANCMKDQGFGTAADPAALATQPGSRSPNPSSTEIATAIADATCTRSSNLSGTYFAVEAGYQNELIQKNQQALTAIQSANKIEIANAAKIVGAS